MSKPKLPSRPSDIWEGGFISGAARDVKAVEARGGMVVAGGEDIWLLKAGDENWKTRPPPEDIGPMHAVAVEPRGARRYAVASETLFALFWKNKQGDQLLRIRPQDSTARATHLAWGGVKGPCALYVLYDDRTLCRMKPDLSEFEPLEIDEMTALASDDSGVVAMVSLSGDEPRVYVTSDGIELSFRPITEEIEEDASVAIAVAGTAVALVIDERYVLLSRGLEAPFERVEALASPEGSGWRTGAIAFQGASSDAALLCSRWEKDLTRIIRVDPSGATMSIAEMGASEGADPPEITSLSWDASRQTLWGAAPYVGVFRSVAPTARGTKKPLLS